MIKLALTDLDDTLIASGNGCASERARRAIHAMQDAGLHFGPVSGRIPASMSWMFAGDDACCATGAYVNGQVLYVDGKVARIVWIDAEPLRRLAAFLDELDDAYLAIYNPFEEGDSFLLTSHGDRLKNGRQPLERQIDRCRDHLDEERYIKANILFCETPFDKIVEVRDLLKGHFPELSFVMPSSFARIIDILPAGWSKGTAALALAEELGVEPDEVATFGDSENDLAMIEAVPNSVAVANASPEVKAAARWHIGASADDAVTDALEQIVAAASTGGMPAFMQE